MPGAARLTWDVQSGVTGFQVQWKEMTDTATACGTSSYGNWQAVPYGGVSRAGSETDVVMGHTVENLNDGTRYCFRVRALNGTLTSLASPGEEATPGAAPSAPIDWESGGESRSLTADGANAEVTLSWPARTAITNYPVETVWQYRQRDASGGATRCTGRSWGAWQNITSSRTANGYLTSRYTVKSLTNGRTYCFQVRGKVRALEGVPSLEARARPTASPATPGQAQLLDVRPGNQQVSLFVIRPLRTVSYEVRQKTTTAANCSSGTWGTAAAVSQAVVS